jgi:excisionase family DNA binding protein
MRNHDQFVDEDATTGVFAPRSKTPGPLPPRAHDDRLWDTNDVAKYLKVSRSWVYHRAEAGQLPCVRVGGLLRFDPSAICASVRGDAMPNKPVVAFAKKSRR